MIVVTSEWHCRDAVTASPPSCSRRDNCPACWWSSTSCAAAGEMFKRAKDQDTSTCEQVLSLLPCITWLHKPASVAFLSQSVAPC